MPVDSACRSLKLDGIVTISRQIHENGIGLPYASVERSPEEAGVGASLRPWQPHFKVPMSRNGQNSRVRLAF
jgi:hypothetical protein